MYKLLEIQYTFIFIILHYVYYLQFKFTIICIFFSQMSKERVNIKCNAVEAIDFVLKSGDEDIGEVVDNNDSSDSSKYEEDKHDTVTLIQNNEQGENLDTVEQGDTVGVSQI